MATKRKFQILAKVEDQPGVVAPNLVAVANAQILVSDPVLTYDRETFERNINRTSLTPLTPIEGVVEANCTFRVELTGTSASVGTAPDWGILLQACGFKQQVMGLLTGASANSGGDGALFSNETVNSNFSGTPSAEAIHDMWYGSTRFYYANRTAAFLPGTTLLDGATSGAQFAVTPGAETVTHGICWRPLSEGTVTLTGTVISGDTSVGDVIIGQTGGSVLQVTESNFSTTVTCIILDVGSFISANEVFNDTGGDLVITLAASNFVAQVDWPTVSLGLIEDGVQRLIKGCRGSVTFTANIGEPMFMDFDFKGLISSITDGQLSGTVVPTSLVPPPFLEIGYGVAKASPIVAPADEFEGCINSFTAEVRNEIAIERCAASTDGTRGAAFASGRAVTGSIDPSVRPEASFPWLDIYRNGTIFRQRLTIGSAAENQFHISLPACQITSEGAGDRAGLATRDLQYTASGQQPNGVDGEDREIVLSLHQSETFVR